MPTLLLTHDAVLDHETPSGHPERADRIRAVNKVLDQDMFTDLIREEAPKGTMADVALVHPQAYIDRIPGAAASRVRSSRIFSKDAGVAHSSQL